MMAPITGERVDGHSVRGYDVMLVVVVVVVIVVRSCRRLTRSQRGGRGMRDCGHKSGRTYRTVKLGGTGYLGRSGDALRCNTVRQHLVLLSTVLVVHWLFLGINNVRSDL